MSSEEPALASAPPAVAELPSRPGVAGSSSIGNPGNYKAAWTSRRNYELNRSNNDTVKISEGWRRVDGKSWVGSCRAARAHRVPPGVKWHEVRARVTEDSSTGEVIESVDTDTIPFSSAMAGRRLDRVRDIITRVELRAKTSPVSRKEVSHEPMRRGLRELLNRAARDERLAGVLKSEGPNDARPKWADMDSDGED